VVTGVGAAFNHMKDSTGEAVVVIGAGGVGLSAIMGLNLIGAHPVIAVDTVDARLERARTVGATHVINPATVTDVGAEVARINGRAAKWVLDAVGAAGTLSQAVEMVGVGGTVVAVGLGKVGATFDVAINPLVQQEKRIIGSLYGSSNMPIEIPEILRLHKAGKLPLDRLIGSRSELPQINEAYREMTQGAIGRAVITIDASATDHDLLSAPRLADISAAPARTSST